MTGMRRLSDIGAGPPLSPSKSTGVIGQLYLDPLHGLGAYAVRVDRAAQAVPGQEIAADGGFLCVGIRGRPTCLPCALDPLGNESALELRQAGHDPEDQLALRNRGVGILAVADKLDAQRPELLEGITSSCIERANRS
jgi:hypothetical protein